MADLTSPTVIHIVEWQDKFDAPATATLVAISSGLCPVMYDSSGNLVPGDANAGGLNDFEGVATTEVSRTGQASTVVRKGLLDVGNMLADVPIGASIYLSDTAGKFSDTPGTNVVIIGRVVPAWGNLTADKLLLVGKGGY